MISDLPFIFFSIVIIIIIIIIMLFIKEKVINIHREMIPINSMK